MKQSFGVVLCLLCAARVSAQVFDAHAATLVACDDATVADVAAWLCTTDSIVAQMLAEQGYAVCYGDTTVLLAGDSLVGSMAFALAEDKLTCLGQLVQMCLAHESDRQLFAHYWNGGGNVQLSATQFLCVLMTLCQLDDTALYRESPLPERVVSFYGTALEQSFGRATMVLDSNYRYVGMHDVYDFDRHPFGVRPLRYELLVRAIRILSPHRSSPFTIHFGLE